MTNGAARIKILLLANAPLGLYLKFHLSGSQNTPWVEHRSTQQEEAMKNIDPFYKITNLMYTGSYQGR